MIRVFLKNFSTHFFRSIIPLKIMIKPITAGILPNGKCSFVKYQNAIKAKPIINNEAIFIYLLAGALSLNNLKSKLSIRALNDASIMFGDTPIVNQFFP